MPTKPIKLCIAGATGWTGSNITKAVLSSPDFQLVGAIARKDIGKDIGEVLGIDAAEINGATGIRGTAEINSATGIKITPSLEELIGKTSIDVLIDYTTPDSVKARTLFALDKGIRVVIGTSGLTPSDFSDIQKVAAQKSLGVIACGNFSITAALAKHFSLIAAQYLPSWEIIEYAHEDKPDAPSGTARELAQSLAHMKSNAQSLSQMKSHKRPVESTIGYKEARGANLSGTQVHSIRLPGFASSFETIFGLPQERLTIRHDSGGANPYVQGTLLATKRVMEIQGLVQGLDTLLFTEDV